MSEAGADDDRPGNLEWSVCGASVTGSQHLSRGLGCDDAFAYGMTGHFVVAAVADGAGSVTGTSAWGSHVASQSVVRAAMAPPFISTFYAAEPDQAQDMMRWLFTGALEQVTAQADEMGLAVPLLSTTLCVALARPNLAIFAQIGDGIIAVEEPGGIATLLTEDKSEYANATWFIQSNDAFDISYRVAVRREVNAFALSTDGMSYKITNIVSGEAYEPFFRTAWSSVKSNAEASEFAAMLRSIQDDQTGDDKTMVLATLEWREDKFFPSAHPVQRSTVSSPPPPAVPAAQQSPSQPEPPVAEGDPVDLPEAASEPPAKWHIRRRKSEKQSGAIR